jgi:3-hydroxyisobutyrate dehydrogenase
MTKTIIGFIGMGLMGVPMSKRLLDAGYTVNIWNRSQEKCVEVEQHGATLSNSIAALVQQSDIIMTCVTDTSAIEAIIFSDDFLKNANSKKLLIDFSSIDPSKTKDFASKLLNETGMPWIDCPVSGGVAGAESGNLVMMAGGDAQHIETVRPILSHLSQRVTHMGGISSGQATKVCNQMIVSCNILLMAEVLALAEKSGIDSQKIPTALAGGFADSIPFQLTGQRMVDKEFDEIKWHVKTLAKDLDLAAVMSHTNDGETPISSLAQRLMRQYSDEGYAEKDPANLIKAYLN